MPADEGLGFDNYQGVKNRDHKTKEKRAVGGERAGWNSVFLVEGKLLAQEQYFGTQGSSGRKCHRKKWVLWATVVIRIRTNDRSSCTVLSMFTWGFTGSSL